MELSFSQSSRQSSGRRRKAINFLLLSMFLNSCMGEAEPTTERSRRENMMIKCSLWASVVTLLWNIYIFIVCNFYFHPVSLCLLPDCLERIEVVLSYGNDMTNWSYRQATDRRRVNFARGNCWKIYNFELFLSSARRTTWILEIKIIIEFESLVSARGWEKGKAIVMVKFLWVQVLVFAIKNSLKLPRSKAIDGGAKRTVEWMQRSTTFNSCNPNSQFIFTQFTRRADVFAAGADVEWGWK